MTPTRIRTVLVLAGSLLGLSACVIFPDQDNAMAVPSDRVHVFYYNWYGNPDIDGQWQHWDHQIHLKEGGGGRHVPPEDIGSPFYPAHGLYSSNDPVVMAKHMEDMRQAGIGVMAVTWWGIGDISDTGLDLIFDTAAQYGIRVAFHIEPFPGRNAKTFKEALAYLLGKYGDHPALYRDPARGNRPYVYLYDSYLIPAAEWATVLAPEATDTIRGTALDAVVIGLWVKAQDGAFMVEGHFDGYYTYFATDGFSFGSTYANWPVLARFAEEHDLLFIPSVGPGYDDIPIRPWNTNNTRDREQGAYYDRMFEAALKADPDIISITSFNEWHEGTQIEPAVPKQTEHYTYLDYGNLGPAGYLDKTAAWVQAWENLRLAPVKR